MAGYTRNDTPNNIADGNVINASDLDGEFNAVEAAFNASTGHTHDGTAAEGAPIEVVGPAQDLVVTAAKVEPKTDNTLDLGSATKEFKDLYLDGTANIDTLTVDENATVTGNLTVNGNTTLGNAATDTVTVTADVASDLIPSADGTYDLGASGSEWQDLYIDGTANIDSLVADTADINGGSIDGATLGTNSAITEAQVDNININGNIISSTDTNGNIAITPDGTGEVDISKVDIDSGTIDGVTIGGSSAGAGTFTNLTATGTTTLAGASTSADITFGDNDKAIFGVGSDLQIYHDGSSSYISDQGTGNLIVQASANLVFRDASNTETLATFATNGAASLYYDNSAKLATTATGIDVTGTVTADGLTVDGDAVVSSANARLRLKETDTTDNDTQLQTTGGVFKISRLDDDDSTATQRFTIDNATGDISFYEDTGTTPKLFWDASAESLTLGTNAFNYKLNVQDTASGATLTPLVICNDADGGASDAVAQSFGLYRGSFARDAAKVLVGKENTWTDNASVNSFMAFHTQDANTLAERMRIDSSGNLLVGTTDNTLYDNTTGSGIALTSGGRLDVNRSADICAIFNRTGNSDGVIQQFRKDGSTVGSIGTTGSLLFIQGTGSNGVLLNTPEGGSNGFKIVDNASNARKFEPTLDNTYDLGGASTRLDDIYATNGTIQTSDRNEKQDIEELSEAEQRVAVAAKALMRKFRWKDAVEEKGDDARIHFGIIAQDLQAAFEAEGLDAGRYAMFCSDTWWEAEETYTDDEGVEQTRTKTYDTAEEAPEGAVERTRLGVRYPELLAFIIAAI